jgi:uncharacterized membrane protein YeiH
VLLLCLDYLGTFAFAISGALTAARHRLDWFGLVVLAAVTAVGGGTIRDLLIGQVPPFCLQDESYLLLALVAAMAVVGLHRHITRRERALLVADAIGLGVFTVIGAARATEAGLGWVGTVGLACLTGVGGGVIRDLLVREVPLVLRKEVYASASIAGALLYRWLVHTSLPTGLTTALCAAAVIAIRLYCMWRTVDLPRLEVPDGGGTAGSAEGTEDASPDQVI